MRRGEDLPVDRPEGGCPPGGRVRRPAGVQVLPRPRGRGLPEGQQAGRAEAEEEEGSVCPTVKREDFRAGKDGAELRWPVLGVRPASAVPTLPRPAGALLLWFAWREPRFHSRR